ncbi:glycosyltransferase family 2 protein [Phycisphaera mikurensis]|nr:glycosyltransferase [Phycisphaera mikurensis]MBB6440937.1 GT2 family glycosyltransferase [Phycisphaera mikurensis]
MPEREASLTVVIPSADRPGTLERCLASLAAQRLRPGAVKVGLDGGAGARVEALHRRWSPHVPGLDVRALPRAGSQPARAALLASVQTPYTLCLNDDVEAQPTLVEAHLDRLGAGDPVLVTGPCRQSAADPADPRPATLLDRLVEETDLVFFDASAAAAAGELTYRHCYGLNLSAATELLRRDGGFLDLPGRYGYEDLELAWRLTRRHGVALRWAAGAGVVHTHRLSVEQLCVREERLGATAWDVAARNGGFMRELLGLDCRSADHLSFCRRAVDRGAADAARCRASFERLAAMPAETIPPGSPLLIELQHFWIPLKRQLWRQGLILGAEQEKGRAG